LILRGASRLVGRPPDDEWDFRDDFALQGFGGGDEDDDVEDIADEPVDDDDDDDDI